MSHQELIETRDVVPAQTIDMHRAIQALIGELQALDANNQRIEACTDPELRLLLAHQRDTGRRQLAMLLEWMRRRDARLDKDMKELMFKAGPIVAQYHYKEERDE